MADSVFEADDRIDPDKNYLEEYVGEGKKFADAAELARAKAESDAFIERMKRENAELRKEVEIRTGLEDFLNQQKVLRTKDSPTQPDNPPPAQRDEPAQPNPVDVETLVNDVISKRTAAERREQNLRQVVDVLRKNYGNGYSKVMEDKAVELGVGKDWLDNLAKEQPKAFLNLVGVSDSPSRQPNPAPAARANPGLGKSDVKNFNYYEAIRKSDPVKYASLQKEIMQQAMAFAARGEDFYA